MKDYTGKIIYVGVDVHKKTYAVTSICEKEIVKRDTIQAKPKILLNYLHKYFKDAEIKTVYEAGFSGFVLHRYLRKHGIDNKVVHAANVETSARDRVKTDKRDSLKLAIQLSDGRLECIHIPSPERESQRELSRLREKVMNDKKRVGNRLKSLLYRQGLIEPEDERVISRPWIKEVAKYKGDKNIEMFIKVCCDEWNYLDKQIKEIDMALEQQAQEDNELESVYRSAPGIGPVHARVLANELEDMSHFSNEKKLFSFTGLTPTEYSSGEHRRQGHISHQGRSVLRKVLVQASWIAIYKDNSLRIIFERIAKTAGKKRAIIAIARRLIGRLRSCFRTETLYQAIDIDEQTGEILGLG